jgi:hypothetical protein
MTCTADKSSPTSPPPRPPIASFYSFSWWWLKTNLYLLMKELCGRWDMIRASWWLFGKDTNSSEHKRQNYATSGWILTFFAVVVQRDCRTVPPSMEGQGALGAMIGACTIAVANTNLSEHKHQNQKVGGFLPFCAAVVQRGHSTVPPSMEGRGALGTMMGACPIHDGRDRRTCRWWDAAIMWPLEGISPFFSMMAVLDQLVEVFCWVWWCRELASGRCLRLVLDI